jgi:hypothetical protein
MVSAIANKDVRSELPCFVVHDAARRFEKHGLTISRRTLSKTDQLEFIRASICLTQKRSRSREFFPGALSRNDDFAASHINASGPSIGSIAISMYSGSHVG